jgi:hypothetical protein
MHVVLLSGGRRFVCGKTGVSFYLAVCDPLMFPKPAFSRVERIAKRHVRICVLRIRGMRSPDDDDAAGHGKTDVNIEQPTVRGTLVRALDQNVTAGNVRAEFLKTTGQLADPVLEEARGGHVPVRNL